MKPSAHFLLVLIVALAFALVGALGGGAVAPAATVTLYASDGPGYTITLTDAAGNPVRQLTAGTYTIVVNDQATNHDFHLTGPGAVDLSTTNEFVGQVTWTVTLVAGSYHFVCDPHADGMFGDFTVVAPDTTPPDTTITTGPSGSVNATSASFGFSANEAGSTFECALDAGAFAACTSPKSYTALANGQHSFQVRAIDAAGNVDASPASRAWTVDTVAPDTTITSGPSGTVGSTSATFGFSSNEAGASFQCSLDGAAFAACSSPKGYTGLGGGSHSFRVRAVDAAGNLDATPAGRSWTINATPPETTIVLAPSGTVGSSSATFEFQSSKPGSSFQCSLDGAAFTACTSPASYFDLAQGAHTFQVRAIDSAGNVDPTPASASWTIDANPPETTIDSGPSGAVNAGTASFSFSASKPGSTFECSLDGAAFGPCSSPVSSTGLAEGPHSFEVRASDALGNADPSPASASWTVDTTAPDTTIDSGPSGTVGASTSSLAFSSNEAGSSFECAVDGAAFSPCSSPRSYAGLADGAHSFSVRARDAAGNVDPSPASRGWTINSSALYATDGPGYTITLTDAAGSRVTRLDAGSYTIVVKDLSAFHNFHLLGPGVDKTTSLAFTGEVIWTVTLGGGAYHFQCDPHPGMEGDFAVVSADRTPPETAIDSGPSGSIASAAGGFSFSASEPGASFQCSVDGAVFAACSSPQSYAGLADGLHSFQVRATDSAGNTDPSPASRSWTIDTTPPETSIDFGPTGDVISALADFQFSSSEPGAGFECSLDGGSFAACSSPASYAGLVAGGHTFRVQAIDAVGNVDTSPASRSWTIIGLDTTPPETTIDSGPSGAVSSGSATFVFSASETGASFQCSLDGGAFVPCTPPQSYSALPAGDHTFQVTATDAAGNGETTPASRSWTIDPDPPETNIVSGPSATVSSASASFEFASSEAGSNFRCALDGGAFAACSSPQSYSGLADGAHSFQVQAIDAAGNADPTAAIRTWTVAPPAQLVASALSFNVSTMTVSAGTVTLSMVNQSVVWHNVAIRGNGIDVQGPVVGQGGISTVTADLTPGTYEFYCSVPGHEQAGMKGTLVVTGDGSATPTTPTTPTTPATGGSGSGTSSASTQLVASALSFNVSTLAAKAGTVTISMLNQSAIPHNIAIRGNGVDVQGPVVGQGGTSTVTADLAPGTYEFYCSVPGHAEAGMKGTLIVTADAPATPTTPTETTPPTTTEAPPAPTETREASGPTAPPSVRLSCTGLAFTLEGVLVGVAPDSGSLALRVKKVKGQTARARQRARRYVGKQTAVLLHAKTQIRRGGRPAAVGDLAAGDGLSVQARLCKVNGRRGLRLTASSLAARPAAAGPSGVPGALQLTATGLKYDKVRLEARAGKVTITMRNDSPLEHNVAIRGNGVQVEGPVVRKGGTSTVTAELAPGTYEYYCSVPGHLQAGMKGVLTVTP